MKTDAEVRLLRRKLMEGKTLEAAAAAAGMSEETARKYRQGPLPSESKKPRHWRTREDPFAEVWTTEIEPLLQADEDGTLEAQAVFAELQQRYPEHFENGQLRTLQRRFRDWRAVYGPEKTVVFPQVHPPGREAAFDFTHAGELGVTILGVALKHLLFVFRLSASGWTWIEVAYGETYEALLSGLQGALWALSGAPKVVRHDNLSAATHELKKGGGRSLNKRFKDVLEHYNLESTRIKPGESHENGGAEKNNDLVKSALRQALKLRGGTDFESVDAYLAFAREAIDKTINQRAVARLAEERPHLRPLPESPVPCYTQSTLTVRSWSTIRVAGRNYSVPSRLIGHEVEVRLHPNIVEVHYKGKLIETMPRLRGDRTAYIDYRHIIWSLVRKPGAFARYKFREELFPTLTFRRAYDALVATRGGRADIEYVRILHLAASTMETTVEQALETLLTQNTEFDYAAVKVIAKPEDTHVPQLSIGSPDLAQYDALLMTGGAR
jgi:transposase